MNEMVELFRSIDGIKKIAKYNLLIDKTSLDPITDVKNKVKNTDIFKRQNNKRNFLFVINLFPKPFCPSLRNANAVHTNNLGALYPLKYSQTII